MIVHNLCIVDPTDGVDKISFVSNPANETPLVSLDDSTDVRFVMGVALIPNQPIVRKTEERGIHNITFSKEVIKEIAGTYLVNAKCLNFDIEHTGTVSGISTYESFILNKNETGYLPSEYNNIVDGSWILVFKIENKRLIKAIDSGVVRGISIDGIFCYESDIEQEFRDIYSDLLKLK